MRWESAFHTLGTRTVGVGVENTDHWPLLFFAQREVGLREMTSETVVRVE